MKVKTLMILILIAVFAMLVHIFILKYTNGVDGDGKILSLGRISDAPVVHVWWGFRVGDCIYLCVNIVDRGGEQRTSFLKFTPPGSFEEILSIEEFSQREAAVWTGREILIFGGAISKNGNYIPTDQILSFNPETHKLLVLNTSLPYPTTDIAAVWNGEKVYLFLREEVEEGREEVYVFIPENGTIIKLNVSFPEGFEHPGGGVHSIVWSKGGAYFFYGSGIARFDPENRSFDWLNVRILNQSWVRAVAVTDEGIFALGGSAGISKPVNEIIRFNPETGEVCEMESKLPTPRGQSVAVWDGNYIYIFGGYTKNGYANEVLRYDYKKDECRRWLVDSSR